MVFWEHLFGWQNLHVMLIDPTCCHYLPMVMIIFGRHHRSSCRVHVYLMRGMRKTTSEKIIFMIFLCRFFKFVTKLWIVYFQWANLDLQSLNFLLHIFKSTYLLLLSQFCEIHTAWWRHSFLFAFFIRGIHHIPFVISIWIILVNNFIVIDRRLLFILHYQ